MANILQEKIEGYNRILKGETGLDSIKDKDVKDTLTDKEIYLISLDNDNSKLHEYYCSQFDRIDKAYEVALVDFAGRNAIDQLDEFNTLSKLKEEMNELDEQYNLVYKLLDEVIKLVNG